MSLQRGINLRSLAEKMGQCSGAEVRGICTEAGMYALRERRQHVTQEDFEFAIAKVGCLALHNELHTDTSDLLIGIEEEPGRKYVRQQVVLIVRLVVYPVLYYFVTGSYWIVDKRPFSWSRHDDRPHVTTTSTLHHPRHTCHTFCNQHRTKWYRCALRCWPPGHARQPTVLGTIW